MPVILFIPIFIVLFLVAVVVFIIWAAKNGVLDITDQRVVYTREFGEKYEFALEKNEIESVDYDDGMRVTIHAKDGSAYSFRALQNIEAVATDKQRGQIKEVKTSVHLTGFNSIFAVSSIDMAKAYYLEFKRQMQSWPEAKRLRVATIYSYAANEEVDDVNGLLRRHQRSGCQFARLFGIDHSRL